jgi:hypothetical protein
MNYFIANRNKINRTVRLINRPFPLYRDSMTDVLINSLDENDFGKMVISLRRGRDTYIKLKNDIYRRW